MQEVSRIFTALCVRPDMRISGQGDTETEKFMLYMGLYFKETLSRADDKSLANLLTLVAGQYDDRLNISDKAEGKSL